MRLKIACLIALPLALAACTEMPPATEALPGVAVTLPEGTLAMVAPNQDLATVRMLPEDGCLWYRHVGPVETTMLPLRTRQGRPMCTRVEAS